MTNCAMREVSDEATHARVNDLFFLKAMCDAVIAEHIAEHARSLQTLDSIIDSFDQEGEGQKLGDALRTGSLSTQ